MTSIQPRTSFEWALYADATLAGLATLIPLPLVDQIVESFFRRRMLRSIASLEAYTLRPEVTAVLLRGQHQGCLQTCLMLPLNALIEALKRLPRKLFYFLTIKQASDHISYYWHCAFLLDYMMRAGHLTTEKSARTAVTAMDQVLETGTSPLNQLARQVVTGVRHVWRTLRRARHGQEDEVIQQAQANMRRHWADFAGYLEALATRYEHVYQQLREQQE